MFISRSGLLLLLIALFYCTGTEAVLEGFLMFQSKVLQIKISVHLYSIA